MKSLNPPPAIRINAAIAKSNKLKKLTLGPKYKFVGTDAMLPTPSSTYIPDADGLWYVVDAITGEVTAECYTAARLMEIVRTETVTYIAIGPKVPPNMPMLAANYTWYKSSQNQNTITKISIMDSYTPTRSEEESWDASESQDGSVMAYRTGTEVVIAGDGSGKIFANQNSRLAFNGFSAMTTFTGANVLDTAKVTDMAGMFQKCDKLTNLDVSGWDTSKVTNMSFMFNLCNALTSVGDMSGWDTSKVTNMRAMFQNCSALTSLDVTNFDTSNVTDMSFMFNECSKLTSVGDLSAWDTSKVTNMNAMFQNCSGLTSLDVTNFDTSNVTNMSFMFN